MIVVITLRSRVSVSELQPDMSKRSKSRLFSTTWKGSDNLIIIF